MQKEFWNERYAKAEYVYGEEPNEFLKEQLKPGRGVWLFPAEGEGRNAVYAASLGIQVVAFDQSEAGRTKAIRLAEKRGVKIEYQVGPVQDIELPKARFDGAALIYAHFLPEFRVDAYRKITGSLKPGARIIFEAFSKKQVEYQARGEKSGGPQDIAMLFSEDEVRSLFAGIEFDLLEAREIELREGEHHHGKGHVVRFTGRKL